MLSSELAELTGVTKRTLRHYHQIGLLPEPPRSASGYRRYHVGHLVRLLRITRMTALGVPLSVLPEVLDDAQAAEELLDELDRQATAEIERLTARRASIDALRHSGAPPDLPPELSALRSSPREIPPGMARHEHEQLILVGHLLGKVSPEGVASLQEEADRGSFASTPLMARFYTLEADTPEEEVATLIEELVAYLEPIAARLADQFALVDPQGSALVDQHNERMLKPVQHRVLRRVQQQLTPHDQT